MALKIRRVDYFYAAAHDKPGEAYRLLSKLAAGEVNLLAFNAIPMGPIHTQLTLFPESNEQLARVAEKTGLDLVGPHHAILVHGDDELGALLDIHGRLYDAQINVYASSGVTDGKGSYGYVLYVKPEDYEGAAQALGI